MQYEEYKENGVKYVRVDKRKARIKYNDGKQVFLIQDMMRLPNEWQMPCPISNNNNGSVMESDFDKRVRGFQYYNCDNECGRGVKYFVKQEDL